MKSLILMLLSLFTLNKEILPDDLFVKAGNSAQNNNEISLVSSDNYKTVIHVSINGFYNRKTDQAGITYDNIYIKDHV